MYKSELSPEVAITDDHRHFPRRRGGAKPPARRSQGGPEPRVLGLRPHPHRRKARLRSSAIRGTRPAGGNPSSNTDPDPAWVQHIGPDEAGRVSTMSGAD